MKRLQLNFPRSILGPEIDYSSLFFFLFCFRFHKPNKKRSDTSFSLISIIVCALENQSKWLRVCKSLLFYFLSLKVVDKINERREREKARAKFNLFCFNQSIDSLEKKITYLDCFFFSTIIFCSMYLYLYE